MGQGIALGLDPLAISHISQNQQMTVGVNLGRGGKFYRLNAPVLPHQLQLSPRLAKRQKALPRHLKIGIRRQKIAHPPSDYGLPG